MNSNKGILFAGALAGLVIITLFALGLGNLGSAAGSSNSATAVPAVQVVVPETMQLSAEEALLAWQQYSAELEKTVSTLQGRENSYQAQMDAANQTILQLQDQLNRSNSAINATAPTTILGNLFTSHEEHEEHEHDD